MIPRATTDDYSASSSCDTAPDSSTYFGGIHPGKSHGQDFSSTLTAPDEAFYTSLALFQMALDEWLPCFVAENDFKFESQPHAAPFEVLRYTPS